MKSPLKSKRNIKRLLTWGIGLVLVAIAGETIASAASNLGAMASSITSNFSALAKLATASSYVIGLGFSVAAIFKFKSHKDNPTQIPIGTPIALTFVAAALLFLPTILNITGGTMFGASGSVAGPSGTIFGS